MCQPTVLLNPVSLALVSLLFLLLLGRNAAAQSRDLCASTSNAEHATLLARGYQASGNIAFARRCFGRAYALSPSATSGYALGVSELQQQDYRAAASHLRHARTLLSNAADPAFRGRLEASYRQALAHVFSLRLQGLAAGAAIHIDGRVWGVTPLHQPLYLLPGRHRLHAVLADGGSLTRELVATAGAGEVLRWGVDTAEQSAAADAPSASDPLRDVLLLTPAVLGLATSAALWAAATDQASAAEVLAGELRKTNGSAACSSSSTMPAQCGSLAQLDRSADRLRAGALGSAIGGALLLAGGIALVVALHDREPAPLALLPLVFPSGGGAHLKLAF